MLDPRPAFGRFTAPPSEPRPRDTSEWIEEAEDTLRDAQNQACSPRKRLALLEQAIQYIERAKGCL